MSTENAKRILYRLRNGLVVEIEPDMSLPLVGSFAGGGGILR